MSRLDLIEHQAKDFTSQPLRDDILALVAAVRAAMARRRCSLDMAYVTGENWDRLAGKLLILEEQESAALAPLLAPVGEASGEGTAL